MFYLCVLIADRPLSEMERDNWWLSIFFKYIYAILRKKMISNI